jgi:hypothetical protein
MEKVIFTTKLSRVIRLNLLQFTGPSVADHGLHHARQTVVMAFSSGAPGNKYRKVEGMSESPCNFFGSIVQKKWGEISILSRLYLHFSKAFQFQAPQHEQIVR